MEQLINKKLILMRGAQGSGKSTAANHIKNYFNGKTVEILEADQYFMRNGVYKFDVNKLHAAHEWCIKETSKHLANGAIVIVSNTNTDSRSIKPYRVIAKQNGLNDDEVCVVLCTGRFQNLHNVPDETVERFRTKCETPLNGIIQYRYDDLKV